MFAEARAGSLDSLDQYDEPWLPLTVEPEVIEDRVANPDPNLIEIQLLRQLKRDESNKVGSAEQCEAQATRLRIENNILTKLLENLDSGKVVMVHKGRYMDVAGEFMIWSQGIEKASANGLKASLTASEQALQTYQKQGWAAEVKRNQHEFEEAQTINMLRQEKSPQTLLVVSSFPEDMPEQFAKERGYYPEHKKSAIRIVEVTGDEVSLSQVFVDTPDQTALKIAMRFMGMGTHLADSPTQMLGQRILVDGGKSSLGKLVAVYDEVLHRQAQRKGASKYYYFGREVPERGSYQDLTDDLDKITSFGQPYVETILDFYQELGKALDADGHYSDAVGEKLKKTLSLKKSDGEYVIPEPETRKQLQVALETGRLDETVASTLAYVHLNVIGKNFKKQTATKNFRFEEISKVEQKTLSSQKVWNRTLTSIAERNEWLAFCGYGGGFGQGGFTPSYLNGGESLFGGFKCPNPTCIGWIPPFNGDTCRTCHFDKYEIAQMTGSQVC